MQTRLSNQFKPQMFSYYSISYLQNLSNLANFNPTSLSTLTNQPSTPCPTPPNSPQHFSDSTTSSTLPTMSSTSSSHTTTHSSPPSYNSLGCSSCPLFQEKCSPSPCPPSKRYPHHSRSSLSNTSFTHSHSTHITFAAFPPLLTNAPASILTPAELSQQIALSLLQDPRSYLTLQPGVVAAESIIYSCFAIEKSAELDAAIASFESLRPGSANRSHSSLWACGPLAYYTITGSIFPSDSTFGQRKSATETYQIALRNLADGVDHVILSSDGSVCMRGTMRIESRVPYSDSSSFDEKVDEEVNMERLHLVEELEVRCQKLLGWRVRRKAVERSEGLHERFRERWDGEVRRLISVQRKER